MYPVADMGGWLKGSGPDSWVVEEGFGLGGVKVAMAAAENRMGQVLSMEGIVELGYQVGALGAHVPGPRVVVEKGALW